MQSLAVTSYRDLQPYPPTVSAMQSFTASRGPSTPDSVWLLQHPPVYTQGLAGKAEHIMTQLPHPLVQTDRGGQVTFHDPGQIMGYLLIDIKRKGLSIIDLIDKTEAVLLTLLHQYGINASCDDHLGRGIYVSGKKIASIGFKVRRYCSYHGFALNVATETHAFSHINPCGIRNLAMANITDYAPDATIGCVQHDLIDHIQTQFDYDHVTINQPEKDDVCTTE
jgi:lipoyl(octanoyl) transferase